MNLALKDTGGKRAGGQPFTLAADTRSGQTAPGFPPPPPAGAEGEKPISAFRPKPARLGVA